MTLPSPHGGRLVQLPEVNAALYSMKEVQESIKLTYETAVTVADIKNGIFSPIDGFIGQNDYDSILREQRLENGTPWSIPLMFTIPEGAKESVREGDTKLLSFNGKPLAELEISGLFRIDKEMHAQMVFGNNSPDHPGVLKIRESGEIAVSGRISNASDLELPFGSETLFPAETRRIFSDRGWKSVSAFQTRNVPHRGHEQIQRMALRATDGLFINPVIGRKKPGDYTDEAIMKSYAKLVQSYYPPDRVLLTPLHYEMMYAGPREAVMHAIMRKNYGCTHFIVGRDHAGVGSFYGPYDAQDNLAGFDDLGIEIVPFQETFYCRKCEQLVTDRECPHPASYQDRFSGTKLRELITSEKFPPPEVMRSEVYEVIRSIRQPFVK